jgi:hypothetical protein
MKSGKVVNDQSCLVIKQVEIQRKEGTELHWKSKVEIKK